MTAVDRPVDEAGLKDVIAAADRTGTPLAIKAGGSKIAFGRPVQAAKELDLSGLVGITLYEPAELVLAAKAGTPLATIEAALSERNQCLPFDPPDLRAVLGTDAATPTLGGVVATNLSGPARIRAGAARDLVLGIKAVNGQAEAIQSGGRVMKNVTGYDLCKLLTGSHGTLAALTEITLKVLPAPETSATLVFAGRDDRQAQRLMARALASPFDLSGAAHLPAPISSRSAVAAVAGGGGASMTALRLEGFASSVTYRIRALTDHLVSELDDAGDAVVLEDADSRALWREIRDVRLLSGDLDQPLWRLSTAPSEAAAVVTRLRAAMTFESFGDWGGGLIWLRVLDSQTTGTDAGAAVIRAALAPGGGHATLIGANPSVRAAVEIFQPLDPVLARLSASIKQSFDPNRILNPGRMYREI